MPTFALRKPRLPSHYYVLYEPPDSKGEEVLRFVSERRKVKLKGRSFREFQEYVIPLLDGEHSLDQIEREVADVFRAEDLEAGLDLMASHNLLEDGVEDDAAIRPQTNFFHEVSADPKGAQEKLRNATVTVIGLGGFGATVAMALAGTRIGAVRCLDSLPVSSSDAYLTPVYSPENVGLPRAEIIKQKIIASSPETRASANRESLESELDLAEAVRGSDFVVCCLDPAQSSLTYKLNRVCLAEKIRWTSCAVTGLEAIVGPTVVPGETACYMCYKMRAVACAENPEAEFAFERMLDRRKRDDSGSRENLVFAAGIAANFAGLEVFKMLSGAVPSPTVGRIVVVDLIELNVRKHVVLRKPWCPACFPKGHE
jgi:molybdopterin-synthase adenylyltransferase